MPGLELFEIFTRPLENLGVSYLVTGAVASIVYGEPRTTHDIDLVLDLHTRDVARLPQAFPPQEFYCPPEEVIRVEIARTDRGHFNLIHHDTGYKADIYLKGGHPLHAWAFPRRRTITLPGGSQMSIAPPEYVILRKLEFYREGRSDKHLRDIRGILDVSGAEIDHRALEPWIERLKLIDEWQLVKGSP